MEKTNWGNNEVALENESSLEMAMEDFLEDRLERLVAMQSEEIRKGMDQADTGQFASDAEVEAVFSKWA